MFTTTIFAATQQFTPAQVKQIQGIVHDYLVTNPTVLVEASHALQQQQAAAEQQHAVKAVASFANKIFSNDGRPTAGNPNGDITLVDFFDYQCPHCKAMDPIVTNLTHANPDLKVIYAEWPIFGANSEFATRAALASMEQNKYLPFHTALAAKGYPLSKDDVLHIAKSVGIDIDKLQKDMHKTSVTNLIKNTGALAQQMQLVGTPTFIIGNVKAKKYRYFDGQTNQNTLQQLIDEVK